MTGPRRWTGLFHRYPDLTGGRLAEGGLRLAGKAPVGTAEAPLVSVITVSFNAAATIEQTLLSVQAQTHGAVEHVVVDAASTDGTADILRRHADRLAYFVSEPDAGLYDAMNKGLALASGSLILVLNADDWYAEDCIAALVAAQAASGADFVSGLANYVDGDGRITHVQPAFPYDAGIYFRMPLRHETMLIPAWLYDREGPYDTRYTINADRALTTRLYEGGYRHHQIARPLMYFRNTGVSSTQKDALEQERARMLARYFPGLTPDELATLSRLDRLTPDVLSRIARRYGRPGFSRAAAALAADRRARGDRAWQSATPGMFGDADPAPDAVCEPSLNIATLITSDHGGAGIGSLRRVEALRRAGHNAEIYCLFRKTDLPYVDRLAPGIEGGRRASPRALHDAWREAAVLTRDEEPALSARELFSKTGTVVDFRSNRPVFEAADIVHMHWVSGVLDYANADQLADRPVVWTLADMNAFTGGCHYSEGCEGYRRDCRDCPLLGGGSDLAHRGWLAKRDAYARIPDLHVVCPSQWMADRVRESSLLGDRPVHVIPNALPVHRFTPVNRLVARRRLGLPLRARLVAFGADNLGNRRKGGDILRDAIGRLTAMGRAEGVEGLFFGANTLDLGIRAHSMGHVTDEERMSLIYAAADVFAFPSREDNAPLTVVEAMLSGTPVVGFPVGNVPDLVSHRDTGYIAAYEDAEDFARGLAWALEAPDQVPALERRLRGHAHARRHNDPATAAARHVALYRSILAQGAAGS
ncbi:glycosyltransferase [Paracoccus spongiarum]|uniref:Glycosyltransferase n=1 Tax=Paracoccus spongiarum TaxID=3064387 RepID=A0ABT9JCP5_9RHOB|nr:glycosyltransferase [Paracoccus sp. 2205BS29-5]MDP5307544.1 glycosyltransferase [Paracoccus sp. 2205BS29-5]